MSGSVELDAADSVNPETSNFAHNVIGCPEENPERADIPSVNNKPMRSKRQQVPDGALG